MAYARSFFAALHRSVDSLKHSTASVLRLEVASSRESLPVWSISRPEDLAHFATGCDRDIGGLSTMKLDFAQGAGSQGPDDPAAKGPNGYGRFWGTLSNHIPRSAKVERSGYAAMRNRHRSTLFGSQTWDLSRHTHLALRVRNSLALPSSSGPPSVSSALSAASLLGRDPSHLTPAQRAKSALGYGLKEPLGPKYFVNLQTDGPVTSDLFQHRIWFDQGAKDEWQTVVIPLNHFMLLNTGVLASHQIKMMSEAIRTVGISCLLDTPMVPANFTESSADESSSKETTPAALRKTETAGDEVTQQAEEAKPTSSPIDEEDDWARDGALLRRNIEPTTQRGSMRGQSFRFDLGIQAIHAVNSIEEAQELWS